MQANAVTSHQREGKGPELAEMSSRMYAIAAVYDDEEKKFFALASGF